ncbi:S-adenosyl-L-methionine-dependent methyltransferase [Trametes elegans]|nr:S-adenosyl-L-methionine-dependent methyltransferase [Trametes elegans]
MTFTALRALHATIGSAIEDLERLYHERSPSQPLDYPSLDNPYYTTNSHSAHEELAEKLNDDPAVSFATKQIVAACGHLSATVNKPWHGFVDATQAMTIPACLGFLEEAHIVEILREAGAHGLHLRDIHRKIIELRPKDKRPDPSILNVNRLGHILRLLATSHWLREVSPDVFANNRRSAYIDSGKTLEELRTEPENKFVGTDGVAAFAGLSGDEGFKFMSAFSEWLLSDTRTPDAKGSLGAPTADTYTDAYTSSFNLAFNTQLNFFQWLDLPKNRFRHQRFGHAMTGTRSWETKEGILHGFPWADLPPDSVLIDVGGGIGSTSLTVAQAHPHIKVVVEDRPQTVAAAPASWGPKLAPLFESGRMTFRARDLFAPWPSLASGKAPDVFMIRLVLHDWQDEDARNILRLVRGGAGPNTKLLIGDMLLPYACDADDSVSFAPKGSPLLPNLGVANMHGYMIDVLMMGMFGAKERTVDEMKELALSAGWKVTDVRRSPGSLWAYTTAVPV